MMGPLAHDLMNLITSQRPPPHIITFWVRAPTWNSRGVANSQFYRRDWRPEKRRNTLRVTEQ